ncbi:MAG TPA: hypothetical protein VGP13_01380 [Candidatus Paceibacterota bacterium]|jgi:hypothetical protein|nr:hypothetical protein [Candidatus Paceibacterota bacterium]
MNTAVALARLGGYDFGFLRDRFDYDYPQFAGQFSKAVTELKKFYELIVVGVRPLANMSKLVDAAWHTHVNHTPQYRQFCDAVNGGYIDHQPHSEATPVPAEAIGNFYTQYVGRFGQVPQVWLEDIPQNLVPAVMRGGVPAELTRMRWSGWPGRG